VRQQQDWSCGSAAVATVLTFHYAHPITERDALEAMFARGDQQRIQREGFSLLDLKRYLDSLGYEANGYETGLDKLAEAGIPAIVVINDRGYNHFVVVKGIRNGSVLVGDPAKGLRVLSREHFDRMWNPRILFVITARRDRAAFNTAVDWRYMGAPLGPAVSQDGLARVLLSRPGMTDF
jgi:predicted double-glycine peptidase